MKTLLASAILLMVCTASVSSLICYYCTDCPYPFNHNDYRVTTTFSNTGFCAKKSRYADIMVSTSRGAADPGLCNYSGCGWSAQFQTYACCCQSSYCNTGGVTSKSTIAVLLGALTLLVVQSLF